MFFVVNLGRKISKKMSNIKRLYRSNDKKLCGVCAGIAEYFELDPTLIRLLWVIFCLAGGSGIIAYIICALIMPVKSEFDSPNVRPGNGDDVVG